MEIKFRGRGFDGKFYYGDLIHYKDGRVEIYTEIDAQVVDPESVAQFVGYDADGREVYSDDTLIDSSGVEVLTEELIIKYRELGDKFHFFKLKE